MANSVLVLERMKCLSCFESPKSPRMLPCRHVFCENCISGFDKTSYTTANGSFVLYTCDICGKKVSQPDEGVSGYAESDIMEAVGTILSQTAFSLNSEKKSCSVCGQENERAEYHCMQCANDLCNSCKYKHDQAGVFRDHEILGLGEQRALCKHHQGKQVRYFCQNCELLICNTCVPASHSKHKIRYLDNHNFDVTAMLNTLPKMEAQISWHHSEMQRISDDYLVSCTKTAQDIQQFVQELITTIRKHEEKLLAELEQRKKEMVDKWNNNSKAYQNLEKFKSYISQFQDMKFSSQIVFALQYEDLMLRMNMLLKNAKTLQDKNSVKTVQFVPHVSQDLASIGVVKEVVANHKKEADGVDADVTPSMATFIRPASVVDKVSSDKRHSRTVRALSTFDPLSELNDKSLRLSKSRPDSVVDPLPSPSKVESLRQSSGLSSNSFKMADSIKKRSVVRRSKSKADMATKANIRWSSYLGEKYTGDEVSTSPTELSPKNGIRLLSNNLYERAWAINKKGSGPGELKFPWDVAFQGNTLVLTDTDNSRMQFFDSASGSFVRSIMSEVSKPQGITITQTGQIAITDGKDKCVKIFDQDGRFLSSWGQGIFQDPRGIAFTRQGYWVITDARQHMVGLYEPEGRKVSEYGNRHASTFKLHRPFYVAVDSQNRIIVTDSSNHNVKIFDINSASAKRFGSLGSGDGQLKSPNGVATRINGNIVVADCWNHRISEFTPDGVFTRHLIGAHDGLEYPSGMSMDREETIAVTTVLPSALSLFKVKDETFV